MTFKKTDVRDRLGPETTKRIINLR
jgi:hypothetical protein